MDTSAKYIEMCRKATKIQDKWLLDVLDYLYYPDADEVIVWTTCDDNAPPMPDKPVWLPRQDQLYELHSMYNTEPGTAYRICRTFGIWLNSSMAYINAKSIDDQRFDSIEQLLLAFVMEDVGQRWDGSGWVECKC